MWPNDTALSGERNRAGCGGPITGGDSRSSVALDEVVIANEPAAEVGNGVASTSRRISTLDEVVIPEKLEDAEKYARVIPHVLAEGIRSVRAGIVVREEG
jgi:hypothetical protein